MLRSIFCLFLLIQTAIMFSQDVRLANQYFSDGEYEKASVLYAELYKKHPGIDQYFNRYLDCLMGLKKVEESEQLIKKEISKRPKEMQLYVTYGNFLERQAQSEKAEKQYKQAIHNLDADQIQILKLGNAFVNLTKYDLALETFEKGEKLLKGQGTFQYNIADIHRRKGDIQTMMRIYAEGLGNGTMNVATSKNIFSSYVKPEHFKALQILLYEYVQKYPDNTAYPEILEWMFVQSKDYYNALKQVKALDRKLNENGTRVYNLSIIAANDGDYNTAIDAYNYIIQLGPSNTYYLEAKRQSLITRRKRIVEKNTYNKADLIALEQEYEVFKQEYGSSRIGAPMIIEYAELEAIYLNNLDKAILILEELVKNPILDPHVKAQAKLNLGDYYLIKTERWEATLLYSQVDKDFQEDYLGELARFKNARLSYFSGDFLWAKDQCDILKAATSRLISNDAIDLSVFILENINEEDSTETPLTLYSKAELLVYQNRYQEALDTLAEMLRLYPKDKLEDDVWYLEANIFRRLQNTDQEIDRYNKILEHYKDEIRADNALFNLATVYDRQLNNPEKAKELYEKLFIEYSGSTFAVDARKRFRVLRGDTIQ